MLLPPLTHSASANTLVGAAYVSLRRDIIQGKLPPGSRLRVEHLKDDYGVGAGTLREALALLVSDALVIAHGVLLETEALRQSIAVGDDDWESAVLAAFHRLGKAEQRLASDPEARFEEWEQRNREFHRELIRACPSRWMHHFLGILYQQAERYRRLTVTRKPIARDLHDEHQGILDATLARDADRACALLASHIRLTYDAVARLPPELFTPSA
jgi:DNA-binding GntR family transcriptional regulator